MQKHDTFKLTSKIGFSCFSGSWRYVLVGAVLGGKNAYNNLPPRSVFLRKVLFRAKNYQNYVVVNSKIVLICDVWGVCFMRPPPPKRTSSHIWICGWFIIECALGGPSNWVHLACRFAGHMPLVVGSRSQAIGRRHEQEGSRQGTVGKMQYAVYKMHSISQTYAHRTLVSGYVCTCVVSYFATRVFLQQNSTKNTWAKTKV